MQAIYGIVNLVVDTLKKKKETGVTNFNNIFCATQYTQYIITSHVTNVKHINECFTFFFTKSLKPRVYSTLTAFLN